MRKRILFVTNSMSGGGAEKILHIIVSNINKEKFDITICSLHEANNLYDWPQDIKYRSIFKHTYRNIWGRIFLRIGNKIKLLVYDNLPASIFYRCFVQGSYDTEIAFIEGYATRIVGGSTNPKSRKLAWLHIDMYENHWSKIAFHSNKEEILAYKHFDQIFGVSRSVANSIHRLYSDIDVASVVYNPIDELDIRDKSKLYAPLLFQDGNTVNLMSVGRLDKQKGYDRLISIIGDLRDSNYNIKLYIIGEGSERKALEEEIRERQLENVVYLLGYKNNPYPYFVACDAFVCSSRSEGFSTVVTEALILGLPVVSTDCAGMRELLGERSEYGVITENTNEALKAGIIHLLQPEMLAKYKRLSEQRGAQFCLKQLMKRFEECL